MFIFKESETCYMSDIKELLERDRLEFKADQKIKNLVPVLIKSLVNIKNDEL